MFEVAQTAMNDASGAAGNPGGEVILFQQKRVFSGAGALPGHGDAIDASANYYDVKVLAFEGWPVIRS
jgi:hypothetical protein